MKIRGREFGLGLGVRMNKVSVSTITSGVPARVRVVEEMGAGAAKVTEPAAKVKIVKPEAAAAPERVFEAPVASVEEKEEFMEEGLTSPW